MPDFVIGGPAVIVWPRYGRSPIGEAGWFGADNRIIPDAQVIKIGKRWVTIEYDTSGGHKQTVRVDLEDGEMHESDGNGRAYVTMAGYEEAKLLALSWDKLRRLLQNHYSAPRLLQGSAVADFVTVVEQAIADEDDD